MSRLTAFERLGLVAREIRANSGPYASGIDQTDQTDQHIENKGKFDPHPGRKLTRRHAELTSGPDRNPFSRVVP